MAHNGAGGGGGYAPLPNGTSHSSHQAANTIAAQFLPAHAVTPTEATHRGKGGSAPAPSGWAIPDRSEFVQQDVEGAELKYAGQEQCLFKYNLVSIDALAMRNRHIILDVDRVNLLDLVRVRCKDPNCQTPTWMRMKTIRDQSFKFKLVCRGCGRCLQCNKPADECDKIKRHKPAWGGLTWFRIGRRVLWYWMTWFGTLVKVYKLLMRNIFYTVLFAYTASLFQNELDNVKTTVLTTSADTSWSVWFADILSGVGKDIVRWVWTLVVVVALACVLMLVKLFESFYVTISHDFKQRINRLRFDRVEINAAQEEEHARSYANEYYSDDEREGYNDPDVAYMNLSMQDPRSCLRRSRRWCCLHAFK